MFMSSYLRLCVSNPGYEFSNGSMEHEVKERWMRRLISVSYSYHSKGLGS